MKTASAPAKAIILGEHTALYGNQVIAAAINLRSRVTVAKKMLGKGISINAPWASESDSPIMRIRRGTEMINKAVETAGGGNFDIKIESQIPIAAGLGSSASIASALVMALGAENGKEWGLADVARAAWKCEDAVHGKSSGVDPYAVTFGGITCYQNGKVVNLVLKGIPRLVIAESSMKHDTWDIVKDLEGLRRIGGVRFENFVKNSESIVNEGKDAIERGDWENLGKLMDQNHELLKIMGVSNDELDEMVDSARAAGAYGAKLSGAGCGGVIIALVNEETQGNVIKALSGMSKKIIEADISKDGVRLG